MVFQVAAVLASNWSQNGNSSCSDVEIPGVQTASGPPCSARTAELTPGAAQNPELEVGTLHVLYSLKVGPNILN